MDQSKITLPRRLFNKTLGLLGAGAYLKALDHVQAKTNTTNCTMNNLESFNSPIRILDDQIHYWIDGLWGASQANIAIYLNIGNEAGESLNRVIFTNSKSIVIGEVFFNDETIENRKYSRYCIFNRVDLRFDEHYHVVAQVNNSSKNHTSVFRFTLDRPRINHGTIDPTKVPTEMAYDFSQTHKGVCFSSRHFPIKMIKKNWDNENIAHTVDDYSRFFPYTTIEKLDDTDYFKINVKVGHKNLSQNDFTRYVFLCDPSFRFLSIKKLELDSTVHTGGVDLYPLARYYWKKRWGVPGESIPTIGECPYILVFVENPKYGVFCEHIWLR